MPDEIRCPKCGEDRLIERVVTGTTWTYLCNVCATSFPSSPTKESL